MYVFIYLEYLGKRAFFFSFGKFFLLLFFQIMKVNLLSANLDWNSTEFINRKIKNQET